MKQFLYFRDATATYLLDVENVLEVIPMVALQRDEGSADETFCGLLNFRGNIVPVFTLASYHPDECLNIDFFLIVSLCTDGMVAVLAHELDYLVSVAEEDISCIRPNKGKAFMAARVGDSIVRMVNPDEFLQ